jgi:hypothetical protein
VVDTGVTLTYTDQTSSTRVDFSTGDSVVLVHTDFTFANVSSGAFFDFV